MELISYQDNYKPQLALLLRRYFNEVEGGVEGSISDGIDLMIRHDRTIYLLMDKDKAIGFVSLYCYNQFGISKLRAITEIMYIEPNYRCKTSIKLLLLAVGNYCIHNKVDCVIPATTSASEKVCKTLGGEVIGGIYTVPLTSIVNKYKEYT